jgi:hypothetical protein
MAALYKLLEEQIYVRLIVDVQRYIRTQEESMKIQMSDENRREWAVQTANLARLYAAIWEETKT